MEADAIAGIKCDENNGINRPDRHLATATARASVVGCRGVHIVFVS